MLFRSKQESAAGYPAFSLPLVGAPLDLRPDHGWMRRRTRIACARCGALLGHLAGDEAGPPLHQINSAALRFLAD